MPVSRKSLFSLIVLLNTSFAIHIRLLSPEQVIGIEKENCFLELSGLLIGWLEIGILIVNVKLNNGHT